MRLARWGLVFGMVPVVFATTMAVPDELGVLGVLGMGPALGCSAGGNVPQQPEGFTWLAPVQPERDVIPVGTDGFFVIVVGTNGFDAEAASNAMTVTVRNAADEVVPGRTWVLKEEAPGSYLFGWEANDRLELGAELMLSLDGVPWADDQGNVGGDYPLVVAGEPVAVPSPALSWSAVGFFRGAGPNVTCAVDPSDDSCAQVDTVEVPGSLQELQAVDALWQLPEVSVSVAWEALLEPSPRTEEAELPEQGVVFLADEPGPPVSLGLVKFPTAAEQHCVRLSVRDLRLDDVERVEFCFEAEAPTRYETDTELGACIEPPTDATARAWCLLQADLAPPWCEAVLAAGPVGAGGAETEPGGDDAPRRSRTSKGCQLGGATSDHAGAWLVLAALVALRRRR